MNYSDFFLASGFSSEVPKASGWYEVVLDKAAANIVNRYVTVETNGDDPDEAWLGLSYLDENLEPVTADMLFRPFQQ